MSRASIFQFPSVAMSVTPKQLAVLVEYLVLNTDVFLDDAQTTALFKSRTIVSTPISRIFQRMQDIGGQGVFSPFRFRTGVHTINEIASLRHVTFDMDQAADVVTAPVAGAIASQPTISDHILLNVTQYTRASGELTDSIGFQSAVVRDLLSRSFFEDQRTTWMTPNLTQFVCKVYSMTLGSSVAKWYNLDYKSQSLVTALFAYFYLSLMSNPTVAVNTLKTKWRYFYLPEADDLDQVFALVHATLGKESLDSLEDVFATINALGIERIRLNRQILTTRLKTLGPDIMTSGIALEYPPYFTYLILLVLSGSKIGLSYQIKGFGMIKEASAFVEDLIQTTNFAGSLTSSPGVWI